jgi:hypothetical protein
MARTIRLRALLPDMSPDTKVFLWLVTMVAIFVVVMLMQY